MADAHLRTVLILLASFYVLTLNKVAGQARFWAANYDDPFREDLEQTFLASRVGDFGRSDYNYGPLKLGDDAATERAHDLWLANSNNNNNNNNNKIQQPASNNNRPIIEDKTRLPISQDYVGHQEETGWKATNAVMINYPRLGQVSAIALNTSDSSLVIFHRGSTVWDENSFGENGVFLNAGAGPIREDTILFFSPESRGIVRKAGRNMFYMPHGLSLGRGGSIWVTDVALHQVFRLVRSDTEPYLRPELILGEALQPGVDDNHFCQPTSVVEATNEDVIFVADGYCNGRIMKFNSKNGSLLAKFGGPSQATGWLEDAEPGTFLVPHSLALIEESDTICVADRENRRIQCFVAGLRNASDTGRFVAEISHSEFGEIYSLKYAKKANLLMALSRDSSKSQSNKVFAIDAVSGRPFESIVVQGMVNGHDLTVDDQASNIYISEIGPNQIWHLSRAR